MKQGRIVHLDGGAGSGNFGHSGRLGQVGGSGTAGGTAPTPAQYAKYTFARLADKYGDEYDSGKYGHKKDPQGRALYPIVKSLKAGTTLDIDGWRLQKKSDGKWHEIDSDTESDEEDWPLSNSDMAFDYISPKSTKILEPNGKEPKELKGDAFKYMKQIEQQRKSVDSMSDDEKANFLRDNEVLKGEELTSAKRYGELDNYANSYFDAMAMNGDPTPIKKISGQPECPTNLKGKELTAYRKKYIKEATGFTGEKLDKAADAMYKYAMSKGPSSMSEKEVKALDEFIDAAPAYNGEIYRGLTFNRYDKYRDFVDSCQIGSILSNRKTISSWSSKGEVATRFANEQSMEHSSVILVCKKNKTATPVQNLSDYGTGEAEVLAKSNTQWTVVGRDDRSGNGKNSCTIFVIEKDVDG